MERYEVQTCTIKDAAGLAKNNASAFWEEEWWNLLWVNQTRESLIGILAARLPKVLLTDRQVRRHEKIVHVPSGEVVGYARWILPESRKYEWLEAQIPDVSDGERQRAREVYDGADWNPRDLDDMDDPIHTMLYMHEPRKPYLKLDYLCTRPDYQRKGLAGKLVKSGLDKAEELGMDVFLVAMGKSARNMYLRLGFEILGESCQDLKRWGGQGLYETFVMIKRASL